MRSTTRAPQDGAGARRTTPGSWLLPACLLLTVALPLALLAVIVWVLPRPASGLSSETHPVGYPVRTGPDSGVVGATAALAWSQGPSLHAPAWSGLAISVPAAAGQRLTTGSPVAVIDGITRVAVASSTPFYRSLTLGDSGPDVVMLRRALGALGLGGYGTSTRVDDGLVRGIGRLCGHLGGTTTTTVFDPSWFVYLPGPSLTVGAVHLSVGRPAPSAGEEIVTPAAELTGLTVGPLSSGGTATARFPASGDGYEFVDGSVSVPLTAGLGAAGDLTALAGLVAAGTSSVNGTVQLVQPRQVSSVPTTSLVTGTRGETCVYPVGAEADRLKPIVVQVLGGEPGLTYVSPLSISQVLANPSDLDPLAPCS